MSYTLVLEWMPGDLYMSAVTARCTAPTSSYSVVWLPPNKVYQITLYCGSTSLVSFLVGAFRGKAWSYMKNKDIVKYFYEVIVSYNLLDELSKYISEDCVQRVGEKEMFIGIDGMKEHLLALKKTYPDYTMKIIRQYEVDGYVISEFIMKGTHKGEFLGITPTNKVLEITGVDIDKVIDGKIVEHGGATNTFETFFEHHLIQSV